MSNNLVSTLKSQLNHILKVSHQLTHEKCTENINHSNINDGNYIEKLSKFLSDLCTQADLDLKALVDQNCKLEREIKEIQSEIREMVYGSNNNYSDIKTNISVESKYYYDKSIDYIDNPFITKMIKNQDILDNNLQDIANMNNSKKVSINNPSLYSEYLIDLKSKLNSLRWLVQMEINSLKIRVRNVHDQIYTLKSCDNNSGEYCSVWQCECTIPYKINKSGELVEYIKNMSDNKNSNNLSENNITDVSLNRLYFLNTKLREDLKATLPLKRKLKLTLKRRLKHVDFDHLDSNSKEYFQNYNEKENSTGSNGSHKSDNSNDIENNTHKQEINDKNKFHKNNDNNKYDEYLNIIKSLHSNRNAFVSSSLTISTLSTLLHLTDSILKTQRDTRTDLINEIHQYCELIGVQVSYSVSENVSDNVSESKDQGFKVKIPNDLRKEYENEFREMIGVSFTDKYHNISNNTEYIDYNYNTDNLNDNYTGNNLNDNIDNISENNQYNTYIILNNSINTFNMFNNLFKFIYNDKFDKIFTTLESELLKISKVFNL